MEPDQVNSLAPAVLGHFEEVEDPKETGLARQFWSYVRETNGLNRINLDHALFHPIPGPDLDVGTHPDPDAARDFTATNSVAQALSEKH